MNKMNNTDVCMTTNVMLPDFCMEIVESNTSLNEILRFLVKSVDLFTYCQEDADISFTLFSNVSFTDSGERFITRLRLIKFSGMAGFALLIKGREAPHFFEVLSSIF